MQDHSVPFPALEPVTAEERERLAGHSGLVVWLTGLPSAGKSTLAITLERTLLERSIRSFVLDGDAVRRGLNRDLGFTPADRHENIRRVAEVAALFASAGVVAITAFISPYRADRDAARRLVAPGRFIEVHVSTPLEVCERRDAKQMYARARAGDLPDFTGISAPYEVPEHPEFIADAGTASPVELADGIAGTLERLGLLRR